jgi:hypothetical protein
MIFVGGPLLERLNRVGCVGGIIIVIMRAPPVDMETAKGLLILILLIGLRIRLGIRLRMRLWIVLLIFRFVATQHFGDDNRVIENIKNTGGNGRDRNDLHGPGKRGSHLVSRVEYFRVL